MTDTARLAHYVLPAKTMFEQEDLVTAYWHPYLQLRTKLWDPPGEVKTESEIWRLLSERLGFDTRYFPRDDAETSELLRAMLPAAPPGAAAFYSLLASQPVDPTGAGDVAFADLTFQTPSGRIEFASEEAARLWGVDPVPDYVAARRGARVAGRFALSAAAAVVQDARPDPLAVRQPRLGAGTSSDRIGSTCTRRTRRRAASRRATRRPSGTTAAASRCGCGWTKGCGRESCTCWRGGATRATRTSTC